jgi:hypothetical protein
LSARLSVALVAFTIECDNEFEARFMARGHTGSLSLVGWLNLLQYLAHSPRSVAEICDRTYTSATQLGFAIGCIERWGYVEVTLKGRQAPRATKSEGWGSARRITLDTQLTPREKGQVALELWPEVVEAVEGRWQARHGAALEAVAREVSAVAMAPGLAMPEGLPSGWMRGDWRQFPPGEPSDAPGRRFPVLIGQALLAMTILYEQRRRLPLALAANTLRVIHDGGTPVSQLHSLSGISPELTGPQCRVLVRHGLGELTDDPHRRGKSVRLTAGGTRAQREYAHTLDEVQTALGAAGVSATNALAKLLSAKSNGELAIRDAMTPPPGVRRSGAPSPALGRVVTKAAAKTRNRELMHQTQAFLANPFDALPHYPVWDGNRGFGP